MPIDMRREANNIWRQYDRYQGTAGEAVVWFRFDAENSSYHAVYDEGSAAYHAGTRVPALWLDQIEDPEQATDRGRRSTQRLRFAVSTKSLAEAGVPTTEAHGRRIWDDHDAEQAWIDERIHDVVFYDGRYYAVSNFQIRGRLQGLDVIIGVTAIEFMPDDEDVFTEFPASESYS